MWAATLFIFIGALFCNKCKYTSLKCGLVRYAALRSFNVNGNFVYFKIFMVDLGKYFVYIPLLREKFVLFISINYLIKWFWFIKIRLLRYLISGSKISSPSPVSIPKLYLLHVYFKAPSGISLSSLGIVLSTLVWGQTAEDVGNNTRGCTLWRGHELIALLYKGHEP